MMKKGPAKPTETFTKTWEWLERGVHICKLHGSLNWAYCKGENQLDTSLGRQDVHRILSSAGVKCSVCKQEYESPIIPPLFAKNYELPLFKNVWDCAENKLAKADSIVFIGYALPSYDSQVGQLLLRAHVKRSNNVEGQRTWSYGVIDPDDTVHEKFAELIGPAKCNLREEFSTKAFENMIERIELWSAINGTIYY